MKRPLTTLVEGLGHPEGPDVLPDGRIVMVETYTGKLVAWSSELGLHDYSLCGGGPNACVLGSDGAVYLTQNGGTAGAWKAAVMSAPSIQRAWPDGRCETVADNVAGMSLQAPNDLTFGPDGRLYFTDPADYDPDNPGPGRVFAIAPDGTGELLEDLSGSFPNGIAVEADGSIVWSTPTVAGSTGDPATAHRSSSVGCRMGTFPTASRSTSRATCGSPPTQAEGSTSSGPTARSSTSWRPAAAR